MRIPLLWRTLCSFSMRILLCAWLIGLLSPCCFAAEPGISVTMVRVRLEREHNLPYTGKFAGDFPAGIPASPGSGLCFRGIAADGSWLFWGVTDRGPGFAAPYSPGGMRQRVFLLPGFTPSITGLCYKPGSGEITIDESIPLVWKGGRASGLPLPPTREREAEEISLDESFAPVGCDSRGIDTEGIAVSGGGFFWLCDEYRPSLLKADSSGMILSCLEPSRGLPSFLARRGRNRGFEGITVLPGGEVIAALQSPLPAGAQYEDFVRFILYDEKDQACRVLAYPLETGLYRDLKSVRISDLAAIDAHHVLVLEQGPRADVPRKRHTAIYLADLAGASDISGDSGKSPAESKGMKLPAGRGFTPVKKKKLCDLGELGWIHDGFAEGMALVDDRTIVVIDDSDFGAQSCILTADGKRLKGDSRAYTIEKGLLCRGGVPSKDRFAIVPGTPHPTVFILRFPRPLLEW